MNFTWCGQSCGSTSRLFVHDAVYDRVLAGVVAGAKAYVPGIPTDPKTTMGAIVSKEQHDKILSHVDLATAHRAAERVEAGFVWVNSSAAHFLGAPFGGYKQSGIGREESIEELLGFTQLKNVNITL